MAIQAARCSMWLSQFDRPRARQGTAAIARNARGQAVADTTWHVTAVRATVR